MKLLSRVVWSEGMYLGPHHFQVQSRYFEDSIQFATSSLWFAAYGLAGVELDAEALHNGTVSLLHARGIFSDGLTFNMPESDALPEPRAIADLFPPTRDGLTVLLAIPARKPNGANCRINENGAAPVPDGERFTAESRLLQDENTGEGERPVRLGRKNLRLLLDVEPAEDLVTLPLARVVRDGSGHFTYDPNYVPPVLQISASGRLMLMLQRLIEILGEKSATISRGAGGSRAEFSSREIANFWLLHAVNSGLAPLRHLLISKRGHPEELFLELSRLGGALCTFALDSHPRDLPLYDHDNLGDCFEKLDRHIRAHLETIVPTNCLTIPLAAAGNYFYDGEISDQRCLGRSRWVLAVRAAMGEADLMTRAPQLVKVCSPPFVRELVKRALPGLALTHLPVPPPAISARVETQYFGISKSGPCWDHMVQTRRVGVYVPGEIPQPEIEILVVLES
ncbi:MAG TPA: type VI secretion system baseplate subunit TssK [Bryobacteraceae bacterium]|nr:type VI secretion system baseplate subunit TssK [Bryobacteraceae bacterium]